MNTKRSEAIAEIDSFITTLEMPLSQRDVESGWDDAHRLVALAWMKRIKEALEFNGALPKGSIVRTMDSWGVGGSDLFETACRISNHLTKITT
jgi:hypothetical protein